MKNIPKLKLMLEKMNNRFKTSEMLHEISLMNIPEHQALKIYNVACELSELNY